MKETNLGNSITMLENENENESEQPNKRDLAKVQRDIREAKKTLKRLAERKRRLEGEPKQDPALPKEKLSKAKTLEQATTRELLLAMNESAIRDRDLWLKPLIEEISERKKEILAIQEQFGVMSHDLEVEEQSRQELWQAIEALREQQTQSEDRLLELIKDAAPGLLTRFSTIVVVGIVAIQGCYFIVRTFGKLMGW